MAKPWQLIGLLMVAVAATGWAQHPPHAAAPAPHAKTADEASKEPGAESAEQAKSFRGIAAKFNTTPDALEAAYQQAKATNPKLTRGQFVAANMLGHNLSGKGITTDKLLAGLASGKSMGQTLQGLGLSDHETQDAEAAADRDVREADQAADKAATKKADASAPQAKPDSRR
jgi:hypothetical protein